MKARDPEHAGRWLHKVNQRIKQCRRCPLSLEPGVQPVPGYGPAPATIAIIGEAPGEEENSRRQPFVGRSGQLLRSALSDVGIDPEEAFWLNSAMCWPLPSGTKPPPESLDACFVHVRALLNVADPKFVLVVGAVALERIRPGAKISKARGKAIFGRKRAWWPIYHPAFILRGKRNTPWERKWRDDIAGFARLTGSLE